ncbi:MAG: 6-phosphogluconolactonase [Chloroflexota bacterium]
MNFQIRIFKDMENLSRAAAGLFAEKAAEAIAARGRFLTALNGGSTPSRLFQLLAADYRETVDWHHVYIFWGDERCVPPGDAGSNYRQAWDAFLSRVAIPESNLHRIKGELEPVEASRDYALTLSRFASPPLEFPRFDLVYLGMGEDGHTASLFPGSPLDVTEPVIPVTAQYQDRPVNRVTLTPLVFNQARTVAFMVSGEKKAKTLAEVLSDRFDPERLPAQRISPKNGDLLWLLDEDAAGKLPRELTRSFCEG